MSYQRNCPNWISFWVNPRQSKPRNAAVKSRKRWKTLAVWGAKAAELQHLALMALMAAGAVAVSSTISSGWAWAASDQPLWHPKMASLVNPYWAFMALALLTEKKLRHVRNPSHSSHSNQRIKFRRGYPISTHPARRPEQHLFHPVAMATNLAGLGPTGSTRPST